MTKSKRTGLFLIIIRIVSYLLSLLGILLTVSLNWMHMKWGPVSFSTALFQLKTPMVGVDNNLVNTYINDIALPALLDVLLGIVILCVITHAMKVTGYSLQLHFGKMILNITYKPIIVIGTVGLLIGCWIRFPMLAKQTGIPEYVDSVVHRSHIYEDQYVVPSNDIIHFPEQKRNLVLIYVESMESSFASFEEGGCREVSLIPNLTELANDNICFSNTNGFGGATQTEGIGWTMAALLSSSSGVTYNLPIDGNDMQTYSIFLPGLRTLGDILSDEGYRNFFVCGSDAGFGGRRAYYATHGNYEIQDYLYAGEEGYIPSGYHNGFWGMEDSRLFDMAREELTSLAQSSEPFNYTILTSDTHAPEGYICDSCDRQGDELPLETAIRCSDRTVVEFVDWLMEQEWISDTTVVILGEHMIMDDRITDVREGCERHVYNCFINVSPDVVPISTTDRLFSSVDYFPTILAAMGVQIDGDRLGLGTNLFSEHETLLEQMGTDAYNTEVLRHSEYYANNFI